MVAPDLARKLRITTGARLLVLHAPDGFLAALAPQVANVATVAEGTYDVVLAFVPDRAALAETLPSAIQATRAGGVLWIAWPKLSGSIHSDLTRDSLWQLAQPTGWEAVANVALDDDWSALRLRPAEQVRRGRT